MDKHSKCHMCLFIYKSLGFPIFIFFRYLSTSKYKQVTSLAIESQQITAASAVNDFYSCILHNTIAVALINSILFLCHIYVRKDEIKTNYE